MEFSASQVHETESEVCDWLESGVSIDRRALDGRVIDERDIAPPVGTKPVEHRSENLGAEWVVEVDNQVTARERESGRVGAHEANIAAGEFPSIGRAVLFGHLEQRR
jgi:hypothetical protein